MLGCVLPCCMRESGLRCCLSKTVHTVPVCPQDILYANQNDFYSGNRRWVVVFLFGRCFFFGGSIIFLYSGNRRWVVVFLFGLLFNSLLSRQRCIVRGRKGRRGIATASHPLASSLLLFNSLLSLQRCIVCGRKGRRGIATVCLHGRDRFRIFNLDCSFK